MFTKDDLLKTMIEYFPTWSDIRKRSKKSNGGKLLSIVTEELDDVQDNLVQYKKEHFPRFYEGKEELIPYKVYIVPVGEDQEIDLISPKMSITNDYIVFTRDPEQYVFYYDGVLMFQDSIDEITYKINNREYRQVPKESILWNIFDEFGLISGKERKPGENNKDFLSRIYDSYRYLPDSTTEGIRNAIKNYLSDIDPKEITVRKLNEEDLENKGLYEKLNELNQDLFNKKIWDTSLWDHDFSNISYTPHLWGAPLKDAKEGVAQGNSLKVVPEKELMKDSTDIQVYAYDESIASVTDYINQTPINIPISLEATAYQQEINPIPYGLQIHASEAVEITQDDIKFNGYRQQEIEGYIPIESLEKYPHENDPIRIKENILQAGKRYELLFFPNTNFYKDDMHFGNMSIEKVELDKKDLRHETPMYRMEDGVIKNNNILFFGDEIQHFNDSSNLMNTMDGIALHDPFKPGELTLNIKEDMKNQYIFYNEVCERSSLLYEKEKIDYKNAEIINDKIHGDNNSEILIETTMNDFHIELEEGAAILKVLSNDEEITEEIITAPYEKTFFNNKRRNLKAEIKGINQESFIINKLEYNEYEVLFQTQKGEIRKIRNNMMLPDNNNNAVTITVRAISSKEPRLEYVFVGSPFRERDAYKITIDTLEKNKELRLDSNSFVILKAYDGEDLIEEIKGFSTVSMLYPEESEAIVKVNTDKYQNLEIDTYTIYRDFFQGVIEDYIIIPKGESIRHVKVKGMVKELVETRSLDEIIPRSLGEKIYFDNLSEEFSIVRNSGKKEFILLKKSQMFNSKENTIDIVEGINIPENITVVFYIKSTNRRVYANQYERPFDYLFFRSPQSIIHVSHYHGVIFTQGKEIDLPTIYHPPIQNNRLMVYEIKEVTGDKLSASFDGGNYALGRGKITVSVDEENELYQKKEVQYKVYHRAKIQIELDHVFNYNGTEYNLHRLSPKESEEYEFVYHKNNTTQDIAVLNSRYNKLNHSNVSQVKSILIDGQEILKSKYHLLNKEGILVWKTDEFEGEDANIEYEYEYLRFIILKDTSILYKEIQYNTDAYKQRDPILIKDVRDSVVLPESVQGADRYILTSSNPIFNVEIKNDRIEVIKNEKDDIYFYPGYYYQDGKEHYKFANDYTENIEKFGGVELINTKTINNHIFLERSAANLIPNSFMERENYGIVHNVNFTKQSYYKNKGLIESVSPCNIFSKWKKGNMKASFSEEAINQESIHFSPRNEYSYALVKIGAVDKEYISIAGTSDNIWLAENIPVAGVISDQDPFIKLIAPMKKEGNIHYAKLDLRDQKEYYIAIFEESWIDNILMVASEEGAKDIETHKSNITKLGWRMPSTREQKNHVRIFPEFLELDALEISKNVLQVTNTIQWGSTLLKRWANRKEFDQRSVFEGIKFYEDRIIFQGDKSFYETEYIYINNSRDIYMGSLKINNILYKNFEGFDIEVYTKDSANSNSIKIGEISKSNVIDIDFKRVRSYIKFRIKGNKSSTIENIGLFVQYRESENVKSELYPRGEAITPTYRLNKPGNYIVTSINGTKMNAAKFYIRGIQKDHLNRVHTDWLPVKIDPDLEHNNATQSEILRGYQYVQFKIELTNPEDKIEFKEIRVQLEEVS